MALFDIKQRDAIKRLAETYCAKVAATQAEQQACIKGTEFVDIVNHSAGLVCGKLKGDLRKFCEGGAVEVLRRTKDVLG